MTAVDTPPTDETHYRTCPLCEASCGLELTVRDGAVVRIRGDRDNPFSRGFICPKGSALQRIHEDPDRLRRPLVRRGDDPATATWEEVDWPEAYAEIEKGLLPIIEAHGRDAVGVYLGNPNAHTLAGVLYVRPLIRALGTKNLFSASTVDQMPKHVSSGLLFGNALTIPVPDLDRTDYLLMLGANPWESNGSLCTAPDFPGRLKAIQERGGRFVVVDPRRTRTAQEADEHIAIRPGTDAQLLMAIIQVLFADDLVELRHLASITTGVDDVRTLALPFTPEAVAPLCGIEPDTIRRLAHDLAAAPTAAVYGRIGTHTVEFGTLASWAVDVINVLTGNLDRPGGAMIPSPAHERAANGTPGRGFSIGRHHSRVKNLPEVRSEFPVATLADEIETSGEGQIKAMITIAGNPVVSTPDSGRLDDAFHQLDFVVSVDIYRNETTRHANVILPPPSSLERSEYHMAFFALAVHNYAEWSPPLFEPAGPAEHEILSKLALIASGQGADADPAIIDDLLLDGFLEMAQKGEGSPIADRPVAELRAELYGPTAVDQLVDAMIRTGQYGDWFGAKPDGLSLEKVAANEHGVDLGPLQPRFPAALRTRSGTIELAPEMIADEVVRAEHALSTTSHDDLLLVGRRHLRSNNSWMHNVNVLVKGKARCTLQVHPDDATRLSLKDGEPASISSRVGTVVAPVEITDDIRPGVVSLPHGWGHDMAGSSMSVAGAHAGVNSNVLTDGSILDPLSGNAVLNGIPVEVSARVTFAIDPELDAYVDELRNLNGAIQLGTESAPSFSTAAGLAALRAGEGLWGATTVEQALDRELPGPAGPIPARVMLPSEIDGVLLFLHGGGWCIGHATDDEPGLWALATSARVAVVSIDYRLAPEHPFPAGPDDCEAAALWILERGARELGSGRLVIGGGSAGGHLAALTLLRLRDRHDAAGSVAAANLVAGVFDLGMTPSQRASADALVIPLDTLEACYANFLPGVDREARRDPAVSPLYADLHGMPPALFTVGTIDPLLDDSLFMAGRWRAAGADAEVAIYPEAVHGFAAFPTEMARIARARMATFIAAHLSPT